MRKRKLVRAWLYGATICVFTAPRLGAATVSDGHASEGAFEQVPQPQQATSSRVRGVVFDSVSMRPVSGAIVQLVALNESNRIRSALSDSVGRYVVDSLPLGVYMLGFLHDRLDSLKLESALHRVEIRQPGDVDVSLAVPSARTVIARQCGTPVKGQLPTMLVGTVRTAENSEPVANARVRAQWIETFVGPGGIERRTPANYVTTGASGAFVFCGVPTDVTIMTRAFAAADSSGAVELQAPTNGLLIRDLRIGSVAATSARVRGVVRTEKGEPIAGAKLVVWGTGETATSTSNGQFEVSGLPSGTYMLESRAIGYQPLRHALDLHAGIPASANLAMIPVPVVTDTVRVRDRATSAAIPLADFERRRKSGDGHFIDEEQLKRRAAMYLADIFRGFVGITVMQGIYGGDRVLMRASGGARPCVPAVYLNGLSMHTTDGVLDALVNPQDLRAVEVYLHGSSVPIQFQSMNGCGSIVLWTGARATAPRK